MKEATIWTVSEIFIYYIFYIYFITYVYYIYFSLYIYRKTMLKTIFPTKETEKQPENSEVNDLEWRECLINL